MDVFSEFEEFTYNEVVYVKLSSQSISEAVQDILKHTVKVRATPMLCDFDCQYKTSNVETSLVQKLVRVRKISIDQYNDLRDNGFVVILS
jgi:hypothetical protein